MKSLEVLIVTGIIIALVSATLYFFGVYYYTGATCPSCDQTYGIEKYAFVPKNALSAIVFIPLYFYNYLSPKMNLTPDQDINGALALFLSVFFYFLIITLVAIIVIAIYNKLTTQKKAPHHFK